MQWAKNKQYGFTIVELLIVVVVIAILAAITIVAYNGIQNRANNSSVQSEVSSAGKKLDLFFVDNDRYPQTASELTSVIGASTTNGAYANHANALHYCYNPVNKTFAFGGVSKGGRGYLYKSGGVQEITAWPQMSSTALCTNNFAHPTGTGGWTTYRWPNAGWSPGAST